MWTMFHKFYDFMSPSMLIFAVFITLLTYFIGKRKRTRSLKLPPGSLGIPLMGETSSFIKAMKEDKLSEWIKSRAMEDGGIFKTRILGSETVVIAGRAGNKFVLSATDDVLSVKQPQSVVRLAGKNNIFELTGERFKILKGAVTSFLNPECLQKYIGQMDAIVKAQLLNEIKEKDTLQGVLFVKKATFNLTCTILYNLHDDKLKKTLFEDFVQVFKGIWALPINLYGTTYHKALQARIRINKRVQAIIKSRRMQLLEGKISSKDDLLTSLLTLKYETNELLTDDEVLDNFVTLMIASHDTTAMLLSLLVWKLVKDPEIYSKILKEHQQIISEREDPKQDRLTWKEVQQMKYTWRVAQELMRQVPPVFGNFRKATKDITYGGYDIPKGWQVLWLASETHMNSEYFEDPKKFDTSRFENSSRPLPAFVYVPFGSGPRMCIGNEFAKIEALIVVHQLVTNFKMVQVYPDEELKRAPFPCLSKGLPIKLISRNN